MKITKVLTRITLLTLTTGGIMCATGVVQFNHTHTQKSYHTMSMTQLQEEVEVLSQHGDLPFTMGLELMERWTQKSSTLL